MTFTIKKIAEFLGVEIDEEFQLYDDEGVYAPVYRITKYGCEYLRENEWVKYQFDMNHLAGKSVKKLPWKPRNGDKYWYVDVDGTPDYYKFLGDNFDLEHYACKNCFRTEDEAKANINEVTNRLKSIYENGKDEQKSEKPSVEEAVKVLKGYCEECACDRCEFCVDKENGEGCRLKDTPAIWPI